MTTALVQFKDAGKKYYFGLNELEININDYVVVETIRGTEVGKVVKIVELNDSEIEMAIKPILRLAQINDIDAHNKNLEDAKYVTKTVKELTKKLGLDMKVIDSEYTLDKKKVIIYFESDDRVDFRELVKRLSSVYQARIELRQIGPRDSAKVVGGLGPCGLVLCCSKFIGEFDVVSIKMAKNQLVSLNPQKISGLCGKLLCCLKFEDEVYTELKETMPDLNKIVSTPDGDAKVIGLDVLKQKVQVRNAHGVITWYSVSEIK